MNITKLYKVLIIDDNPEFVKSLKSLILDVVESKIEEIQCADNGDEGLQLMRDNFFHVVFMDINMPGTDGITATRFARFEYEKPGMRIIGISFNKEFRYKMQMIRAGANSYITKDELDADRIMEIFSAE